MELKKKIEKKITDNYSQASQDLFVLMCLSGKERGTYLEIGASDPIKYSNTYLLEKDFFWTGKSIDLIENSDYKKIRKNEYLVKNALEIDYKDLLKDYSSRIDYLSLDIDPMDQTLKCLKMLPLSDYRFSVITYEHDFYSQHSHISYPIREESRKVLSENGYVLVCSDVMVNVADSTWIAPFEDWWVDPLVIDEKTINIFKSEMQFHKNIIYK
jgi:hypothetical protein